MSVMDTSTSGESPGRPVLTRGYIQNDLYLKSEFE